MASPITALRPFNKQMLWFSPDRGSKGVNGFSNSPLCDGSHQTRHVHPHGGDEQARTTIGGSSH